MRFIGAAMLALVGGAWLALSAIRGAEPRAEPAAQALAPDRWSHRVPNDHVPTTAIEAEFLEVARQLEDGYSYFFGRKLPEMLRAELTDSGLPLQQRIEKLSHLSLETLRLGDSARALEQAHEGVTLAETAGLAPEQRSAARLARAIVYLRLAEEQNCLDRHCAQSCLFPIERGGVHQARGPAVRARDDLWSYLESGGRDRHLAQWLLNVVAMTLGEYPSGVPEPYRLPPETLRSEIDPGVFVDVAPEIGLNHPGLAGGVAVADFDRDGLLDVVCSTQDIRGRLCLFRNRGDGQFENIAARAGLADQLGGLHCEAVDYDNDGWFDICVLRGGWQNYTGRTRLSLLKNQGDGTFRDVTRAAGLADPPYPRQVGVWFDYDQDGDLDVYLGNESLTEIREEMRQYTDLADYPCQLYRNNGDGTFTDVATQAGVTNDRGCKGAAAGDYDNDGDLDLYVSNHYSEDPEWGRNRLYRNNGDGTFTDVAESLGVTDPRHSFACWFFDYDNDGWLDLWVSSFDGPGPEIEFRDILADYRGEPIDPARTPRLYRNLAGRGFEDVTRRAGLAHPWMIMGCSFGDVNNDGWLDTYLGTGAPDYVNLMPNQLLINDGGQRFLNATTAARVGHLQKGHGVSLVDLDNDGDQDIYADLGGAFTGDGYTNALFLNPGHAGHFLYLELTGTKSNRQAVGARVRVRVTAEGGSRELHRAAGCVSSFGGSPPRLEIGLGAADRIDEVAVWWPTSGLRSTYRDLPLDSLVAITEGEPEFEVQTLRPVRFPLPVDDHSEHGAVGHVAGNEAGAPTDAAHPSAAAESSAPSATGPHLDEAHAGASADRPERPGVRHPIGPWRLETHGRLLARLTTVPADKATARVEFEPLPPGPVWQVQLEAPLGPLVAGMQYRLRFEARADGPRTFACAISQSAAPWTNLGLYRELALQSEWQVFEAQWTQSHSESHPRLQFDLGSSSAAAELREVAVELVSSAGDGPSASSETTAHASGSPPQEAREPAGDREGQVGTELSRLMKAEELILALTPRLKTLNRAALNFDLPGAEALGLFADEVAANDLAGMAEVPPVTEESRLELRRWVWEFTPSQTTAQDNLNLWGAVWKELDYWDWAKFYLIRGQFRDAAARNFESVVGFEGVGRTRSGQVMQFHGQLAVDWEASPGGSDEWRITGWRLRELTAESTVARLFSERTSDWIREPGLLRQVRASAFMEVARLLVRSQGTYQVPEPPPNNEERGLAVSDWNADGWDDLAAIDSEGRLLLLENRQGRELIDVTSRMGVDGILGAACALFLDVDNDDDADLWVGSQHWPLRCFRREDGRFIERSDELPSEARPDSVSSLAAADYNQDGLVDVYVSTGGLGGGFPFLRERMGTEDLRQFNLLVAGNYADRLPPSERAELLRRAELSDRFADMAGPPNVLLTNRGGGRFARSPVADEVASWHHTFQASWADFDGDGDPDLYCANDYGPNNLFRNRGGERGFDEVAGELRAEDTGFGMGASWGDFDRDGRSDLYVSNMYSKAGRRITGIADPLLGSNIGRMARGNSLLRNQPQGFEHVSGSEPPQLLVEKADWSWGSQFVDFDNDGWLDIHAPCGYYSAPADISMDVDL